MESDFLRNRYDFSKLIQQVQGLESMPSMITDEDTGIEFYDCDKYPKEVLIDLLRDFNILDNLEQEDSKKGYEKNKQLGIKAYQFEPSWVEYAPNQVTIGYVGTYVNSDFELTFTRENNVWSLVS